MKERKEADRESGKSFSIGTEDEANFKNTKIFYSGVVEGFYGKPWTTDQRKELFKRMETFGIDTYLYAPKDDCKHRMYWRDLYSVEEADHLTGLIEAASQHNVTFVYALSPGLDISYSNSKEVTSLKRKLEQVSTFGCKAFALLFDDIDVDMNEADKAVFQSFAHAQVAVTNEVFQYLNQPERFLFCPTEYCSTRAVPTVSQSEYLCTIGSKLLTDIDIMWTGPKVISKSLTIEHVVELCKVLHRPPVIWDNIHANDYDQKRLFLGPYEGRPTNIIPYLRGVLTNPNCEFEANYIPIHTLAQWAKSNVECTKTNPLLSCSPVSSDIKLEREGEVIDSTPLDGYVPKNALHCAIQDWMMEMNKECNAPSRKTAAVPATPIAPPISPIQGPTVPSLNTGSTSFDLNAVEVNESLLQPKTVAPVNSLIDASCDSDIDSGVEQLEPMDCASTVVSEDKVGTGYDSGYADNEQSCNKLDFTETMQIDLEAGIENSTEYLATALSCTDCNKSILNLSLKKICCEDIQLLIDLFYMPFKHGTKSVALLTEFLWLKVNCSAVVKGKTSSVSEEQKEKTEEWRERCLQFHKQVQALIFTLDKFLDIPNKAILQDLFWYIWDVKTILAIVDSFVEWLELGHVPTLSLYYLQGNPYTWASIYYQDAFHSGDQEPWVFRGGIQAEFQRLLPLDGVADLLLPTIPASFSVKMLKVRPYKLSDKGVLNDICRKTCNDGKDGTDNFQGFPDLVGDKQIGGLLEISPEYCFVVEDCRKKIVGYAAACIDISDYHQKMESVWLPLMQEKYPKKDYDQTTVKEAVDHFHNYKAFCPQDLHSRFPSLIRMNVLAENLHDPTIYKRLLSCVVLALKTNGSHGIHTDIDASNQNVVDMYSKSMFHRIPLVDSPDEVVIVGRVI